jgi:nitric-oxide synthase, bacterial
VLPQLLRSVRRARMTGPLVPDVDLGEAEAFVAAFCAENPGSGPASERMGSVRRQIARTGTYEHTPDELAWAAKAAWRHAGRCTGRDKWRTLRLRDRREIRDPEAVAAETVAHLREATNGGRVRSVITVFAPDAPRQLSPRILNDQALRYAGYRHPDGILGDPHNEELTGTAVSLGWQPGSSRFDLLPIVVRDGAGGLHAYPVPPDAVLEVPIRHPDHDDLAGLGLRWYAVPLITDMCLDAGGLHYPCVPFNGWYQAGTEVGVRDLGDEHRYGALPEVARGLGLDTSRPDTFWMDRAAVELALAVHWSYRQAGVMVTDHQSETRRLMKFIEAEEKAGRPWTADWPWVVPPISGSTTPAFHRTYPGPVLRPGFFRHQEGMLAAR